MRQARQCGDRSDGAERSAQAAAVLSDDRGAAARAGLRILFVGSQGHAMSGSVRHAVIVAHPKPDSYTQAMASAYREAGLAGGHEVVFRDLYGMGFDPVLKEAEIPWSPHFAPADDVTAERAVLQDADVFAFFYPIWLNAPPAILKGYLERVFGTGFAYARE